jgi:hypothetical protein
MNADREIVELLRDVRDLIQVLVMRDRGGPMVDLTNESERHSRSWSLLAHRESLQLEEESDDSPLGQCGS